LDNLRKNIINSLFDELDKVTEYAILHHIDKIYSKDDDIDFIVVLNYKRMLDFIKNFVRKYDIFLLNTYLIETDIYRFDIVFFENENFERIELDCACNSKGKDFLKINTSELLKKRTLVNVEGNEFYKISNQDEIEYYLKKKAFKFIDISNYLDYFQSLDKSINKEQLELQYNNFYKIFQSNSFKIKFKISKLILLFHRMLNKQALVIGILGPDGSGKSTIIDKLEQYPLFINRYYFHLKPIVIDESKSVTIDDPHSKSVYSSSKSYLKLFYFIYQYNFGWIKNILKLKIKSSLVIFDRYFDDMLVDYKRYRYGGSLKVAKFARYFIPKPDLYFILTTDADVIYKRKQEVPFEELERQVKKYRELADGKRYFNIDVNRTPEEIVKEIVEIMMEKMNERY
jgi:thymidylate kinase